MKQTSPYSRRLPKRIVVIIVSLTTVIILSVLGGLLYKHAIRSDSVASIITGKPISIGTYRAVNACQALPPSKVKAVFGLDLATQSTYRQYFAEGNHTNAKYLSSECDFGIGPAATNDPEDNIPTIQATVDIQLRNYDSISIPTNIAKQNQTNDFLEARHAGSDTFYVDADNKRVLFSYRNTTLEMALDIPQNNIFSGNQAYKTAVDGSVDGLTKYFQVALPILKQNINSPSLAQTPIEPYDKGKKISSNDSAIIINACDLFSSTDFTGVSHSSENNSRIYLEQRLNQIADAKQVSSAANELGTSICTRTGYISTPAPGSDDDLDNSGGDIFSDYNKTTFPVINEEINYYANPAQALSKTKQLITDLQASSQFKSAGSSLITIPRLGDYAILNNDKSTTTGDDYRIIVVSGSYKLQITFNYQHPYGSSLTAGLKQGSKDQFIQLANLLIAKLPLN